MSDANGPIRLLAVGDVHAEIAILLDVLESLEDYLPDAVLCPGDIGPEVLGHASLVTDRRTELYFLGAEAVLKSLAFLGAPVLFVPGNRDSPRLLAPEGLVGQVTNVDALGGNEPAALGFAGIWGIGGSPLSQAAWPYEWAEDELDPVLQSLGSSWAGKKNRILISHTPPLESYLDVCQPGHEHIGSAAIRGLLRTPEAPTLLVSGHVHESAGVDIVENTLCVNLGSLRSHGHSIGSPVFRDLRRVPTCRFFLIEHSSAATLLTEYEYLRLGSLRLSKVREYSVGDESSLIVIEDGRALALDCTGEGSPPRRRPSQVVRSGRPLGTSARGPRLPSGWKEDHANS